MERFNHSDHDCVYVGPVTTGQRDNEKRTAEIIGANADRSSQTRCRDRFGSVNIGFHT